MSSSSPSSEQSSTPQSASKKNERPQSADKMKTKHAKSPKAGGKGLRNIFKNKKAKENGVVPVKPSCFDDDFVRRPESPDTPLTSSKVKGKDEPRPYGLWRSKVGLLCASYKSLYCIVPNCLRLGLSASARRSQL